MHRQKFYDINSSVVGSERLFTKHWSRYQKITKMWFSASTRELEKWISEIYAGLSMHERWYIFPLHSDPARWVRLPGNVQMWGIGWRGCGRSPPPGKNRWSCLQPFDHRRQLSKECLLETNHLPIDAVRALHFWWLTCWLYDPLCEKRFPHHLQWYGFSPENKRMRWRHRITAHAWKIMCASNWARCKIHLKRNLPLWLISSIIVQ